MARQTPAEYLAAYQAVISAAERAIAEVAAPFVADGRASLEKDEHGTWTVTPTNENASAVGIYVQSDAEISLWPARPGAPYKSAPTVDIYCDEPEELIGWLREYLAAVFGGRVELTLKRGSRKARVRFTLANRVQTHHYNVLLGWLAGRHDGWERLHPEAY